MANPDSESFVRSFARGLGVIEVLGRDARRLAEAEVAEGVGGGRKGGVQHEHAPP